MNWIIGKKKYLEKTHKEYLTKQKISNLEFALDYLCRAVNRDVFIIPPEKEKDHIDYLKKEIEKTLKMLKS